MLKLLQPSSIECWSTMLDQRTILMLIGPQAIALCGNLLTSVAWLQRWYQLRSRGNTVHPLFVHRAWPVDLTRSELLLLLLCPLAWAVRLSRVARTDTCVVQFPFSRPPPKVSTSILAPALRLALFAPAAFAVVSDPVTSRSWPVCACTFGIHLYVSRWIGKASQSSQSNDSDDDPDRLREAS